VQKLSWSPRNRPSESRRRAPQALLYEGASARSLTWLNVSRCEGISRAALRLNPRARPPPAAPGTRSVVVRRAARQASAAGPGRQLAGLSSSWRGCGSATSTAGAAAGLQPLLAHVRTWPRQAQRQESRLSLRGLRRRDPGSLSRQPADL